MNLYRVMQWLPFKGSYRMFCYERATPDIKSESGFFAECLSSPTNNRESVPKQSVYINECFSEIRNSAFWASINLIHKTNFMNKKNLLTLFEIAAITLFFAACKKNDQSGPPLCSGDATVTTSKVVAMGLNNPRGLKFGPDGLLYVAEAGVGGTKSTTGCTQVIPPVGPYTGSDTGSRISVIDWQGNRTTVATNLPSSTTAPGGGSGINGTTDVAFIGNTLYGLEAGAGCSHGVPNIPNIIFKVDDHSKWNAIADYSSYLMQNPVEHPNVGDFEPDGTPYSMISEGGNLYVVEPNHGELDMISPDGKIKRVIDISATQGHIVPTCVVFHDGNFYIGNLNTFPIVQGSSNIYKVTPQGKISVYAKSFTTVLGLAFDDHERLYVLQNTVGADELTPGLGNVVRVDVSGNREVITSGLHLPSAMTFGPDGKLYISDWGIGPPGLGQIVQVSFACEAVRGDKKSD
jgi:hypothetical protein